MPKNLSDFTPASGRMRKEDGSVANIADLIEQLANGGFDSSAIEIALAAIQTLLDNVDVSVGDVGTAVAFCTLAAGQTRDSVERLKSESLGQYGGKEITGVGAVTPDAGFYFFAVQFIADSVVAAQGDVAGIANPDLTAFTVIKAGTTLYGKWSSITLTSGEALGYNRYIVYPT